MCRLYKRFFKAPEVLYAWQVLGKYFAMSDWWEGKPFVSRKTQWPRSGKYDCKSNLEIHGLEKVENRPCLVMKLPGKLGTWQTARSLCASAEGAVDGAQ